MFKANLKLVATIVLAAAMTSGCASVLTYDASGHGYSPEVAKGFQEMKQRQQPDPQVQGWQFINPQDVRPTLDP